MSQGSKLIEMSMGQYFMIHFPVTSNSTITEKDGAL